MQQDSTTKRITTVAAYSALTSGMILIPMNYINYVYTDIAHVGASAASTGMSIASIIGFVFSLFIGMMIQKTKSRLGQFRPWIIGCGILAVGGVFMMLLNYQSATVAMIGITAGYVITNFGADNLMNANYGLYEKFSMGENEARNGIIAFSMMGSNVGSVVLSAAFLTLVALFGKGDERVGFIGAQAVITVLVAVGIVIIFFFGRKYDGDNRNEAASADEYSTTTSVGEMVKSFIGNKAIVALFIADLIKYAGYYYFSFMLVYECTYVLGSLSIMTITMTSMSIIAAVAAMLTPAFIKLCGGRKRSVQIELILAAVSYVACALFGSTVVGFLIPFIIGQFLEGIYLSTVMNCYLDAAEWWYDRTGKDTRAFTMSLQSIGTKISMIIAPILMGIALAMAGYDDLLGITTAEGLAVTRQMTGYIPAVTSILSLLILLVFHKITDKEAEECIARNAERDGYSMDRT